MSYSNQYKSFNFTIFCQIEVDWHYNRSHLPVVQKNLMRVHMMVVGMGTDIQQSSDVGGQQVYCDASLTYHSCQCVSVVHVVRACVLCLMLGWVVYEFRH